MLKLVSYRLGNFYATFGAETVAFTDSDTTVRAGKLQNEFLDAQC